MKQKSLTFPFQKSLTQTSDSAYAWPSPHPSPSPLGRPLPIPDLCPRGGGQGQGEEPWRRGGGICLMCCFQLKRWKFNSAARKVLTHVGPYLALRDGKASRHKNTNTNEHKTGGRRRHEAHLRIVLCCLSTEYTPFMCQHWINSVAWRGFIFL